METTLKEIERAIQILASRINSDVAANEAMALSQAAVNLAHAREKLVHSK